MNKEEIKESNDLLDAWLANKMKDPDIQTKINTFSPRELVEEISAKEHDDPTGHYDNVSINGAIEGFRLYMMLRLALAKTIIKEVTSQFARTYLAGSICEMDKILRDLEGVSES